MDGNDNHVILKEIKHAQEFGFDMITLPSHTSHVVQPINISYFKPFKITLKILGMQLCLESITWNQTIQHLLIG